MSPVKLYHFPLSAPSRGVLLVARALGVSIEIEILDLFKKEHLQDRFLKINPQHCVPTLDDDGFVLWESRAISCYLADRYGKDDQLYPKDLKKRALVHQRLYFDSSTLFPKIRAACFPASQQQSEEETKQQRDELNNALGFLNIFLSNNKWVIGDVYTIADMTIYASISSLLEAGWDITAFTNLERWVKVCAALPGYEENQEGAKAFGAIAKSLRS